MLKQGFIELDINEIYNIHRQESKIHEKRRRELQENQQMTDSQKQIEKQQYSIVRQEIFPSKFTPFFIDNFTKKSSLQIYQYSIGQNDVQKVNQRVRKFYQTLNKFHQYQKQSLSYISQIGILKNFIEESSQVIKQNNGKNPYYSYFQEGKSLSDVQGWRLKHRQNDPHLSYQVRQLLFNQSIILLKFLDTLTLNTQFEKIDINSKDILVVQKQSVNQNDKDFQLKIRLKWTFNTILDKESNSKTQNILISGKKIIIKLLSIEQEKQKLSKLQQLHRNQIQEFKSIDEIIKLKYQDFYTTNKRVQKIQQKPVNLQIDRQQMLQKLKKQIIKLQEKAKQQIKEIKIVSQQPKVNFENQQQKKYFWSQINKIIVKNLSQNQRKNIVLASKKSSQTNKKLQTTKQNKSIVKQSRDKKTNKNLPQNKTQQVKIQAKYLGSGSDLRFRPDKLISLIEQKTLLYVLKVFNKSSNTINHIGCFINAKVSKESIGLFGSYFEDSTKKSFIYSEKNYAFYPLVDKNHAVGYGPQIFLSIGKLDIIIPCFGTEIIDKKQMLKCVSYFPVSYSPQAKYVQSLDQLEQDIQHLSRQQQTKTNTSFNLIGLEKQFFLEQIDIYEIKFKVQ